jgi:pyruvate/2-oxoacid:ferredoxin oxidoreductase beta subunit
VRPFPLLGYVGGSGSCAGCGEATAIRMLLAATRQVYGPESMGIVAATGCNTNTGGQASTACFGGQVTKLSAFGKALHGRPEPRKELGRIVMSHGDVFVAQTTPAHINHFYRAVMEANAYPGPAVIVAYSACMPEHGIADDAATRQAKLAVESRAYPLFVYDPRKGPSIAERLSLTGNPSVKEDWAKEPDGTPIDFLSFARTEGRFAPHFAKDGSPTPEIQATQADRLANWHTLQELAGLR